MNLGQVCADIFWLASSAIAGPTIRQSWKRSLTDSMVSGAI